MFLFSKNIHKLVLGLLLLFASSTTELEARGLFQGAVDWCRRGLGTVQSKLGAALSKRLINHNTSESIFFDQIEPRAKTLPLQTLEIYVLQDARFGNSRSSEYLILTRDHGLFHFVYNPSRSPEVGDYPFDIQPLATLTREFIEQHAHLEKERPKSPLYGYVTSYGRRIELPSVEYTSSRRLLSKLLLSKSRS